MAVSASRPVASCKRLQRRCGQRVESALRRASALSPARALCEWHDRTHTVTVTDEGFEYTGKHYSSLTKIAKKITGAHWSGPRFFGILAAGMPRPDKGRDHE
jgi:hypothetical protein